jgi:hypothetical protein
VKDKDEELALAEKMLPSAGERGTLAGNDNDRTSTCRRRPLLRSMTGTQSVARVVSPTEGNKTYVFSDIFSKKNAATFLRNFKNFSMISMKYRHLAETLTRFLEILQASEKC